MPRTLLQMFAVQESGTKEESDGLEAALTLLAKAFVTEEETKGIASDGSKGYEIGIG